MDHESDVTAVGIPDYYVTVTGFTCTLYIRAM